MVSSGFFNSINHDRLYDARQFTSLFDGIIRDGVFMSVGNHLRTIPGDGMTVLVDTGRAWFNHSWTLNDSLYPIVIPPSELILHRTDAIVLDVYTDRQVRENSIHLVKGNPSQVPGQRPALWKGENNSQYPLAYINVRPGSTSIRTADITIMVGTSETPWVTGILDTVNVDDLLNQWRDQWQMFYEQETADIKNTTDFWKTEWRRWYEAQTKAVQDAFLAWQSEWDLWVREYKLDMNNTAEKWKTLWNSWFYGYVNQNQEMIKIWQQDRDTEFRTWFDSLKVLLEPDVAANLANRILELESCCGIVRDFMDSLNNDHAVYADLYDTGWNHLDNVIDEIAEDVLDIDFDIINGRHASSDPILDSDGHRITAKTVFAIEQQISDRPKIETLTKDSLFLLQEDREKAISANDLSRSLFSMLTPEDITGGVIPKLKIDNVHTDFPIDPKQYSILLKANDEAGTKIYSTTQTIPNLNRISEYYNESEYYPYSAQKNLTSLKRIYYRHKFLGNKVTDEQWESIGNGTFDDMFLGDYWTINGDVYTIVDFNYWYGTSYPSVYKFHLVMMPSQPLSIEKFNDTATNEGAYVGSKMYKTGLNASKEKINAAFGSEHILMHKEFLSSAINNGVVSAGAYYDSTIELPSEIMMFGTRICSSSSYAKSATLSAKQLALYQESDRALTFTTGGTWLRDPVGTTGFANLSKIDGSNMLNSNSEVGVRPVFGICKQN